MIIAARHGSSRAMEELCLAVQPGAYAFLLSMLRNPEDAADALQDSLIRMIKFLPNLREPTAFPGWLLRLLVNQAQTNRRRNPANVIDLATKDDPAADPAESAVTTMAPPPSPRAAAQASELSRLINDAIAGLPPRQRTALILFEMEHMAIREIAATMELTQGAVKFHLHEARKHLRESLQRLGVQPGELTLPQEVAP